MSAARLPVTAGLAVLVASLLALPAHAAPAKRPHCRNLTLDHGTSAALERAWKRGRHFKGVRVHRAHPSYYGRCGRTSYAFAAFFPDKGQKLTQRQEISLQDQPDVFKRRAGRRWRDIGDSGFSVPCGGRAFPRALVSVWHLRCGGGIPSS